MKVVIAASSSLQEEIQKWVTYWTQKCFTVSNYPKLIPKENFEELYPKVHREFFQSIVEADILFVANGIKKGVTGYIGAETFAELAFGLAQKLLHSSNIRLVLANMPDKKVTCYEEIVLWRKLGWVEFV
jgi:hypothetical protein